MHLRSLVNTGLAVAVLLSAITGCTEKETDPVAELKALIPVIEQRLNKRNLAGLKGMGTEAFESNALVIDVFGEHVRDTVRLSLARIIQDGANATLILNLDSRERAGENRQLILQMHGNGKWKLDSYEVVEPLGDTLGS